MGTRDAARAGAGERWVGPPEPVRATGPRAAMRAALAGMSFAQQVEAVRPAVQMARPEPRGDEQEASLLDYHLDQAETEMYLGMARLQPIMGTEALVEVVLLRSSGAPTLEVVVRFLELLRPHLAHVPYGAAVGDRDAMGRYYTQCHETTRLVEAGLAPLGIAVFHGQAHGDWGHSYPVFVDVGLGLLHGDDLYASGAPVQDLLLPPAQIVAYWEERLREFESLYSELGQGESGPDDAAFVADLARSIPSGSVGVPGEAGAAFSVTLAELAQAVPAAAMRRTFLETADYHGLIGMFDAGWLGQQVQQLSDAQSSGGRAQYRLQLLLPDGLPRNNDEAVGLLVRLVLERATGDILAAGGP